MARKIGLKCIELENQGVKNRKINSKKNPHYI